MAKKHRITKRYQEIIKVVSQSIEKQQSFIWKSKDKKRVKYPVVVEKVDLQENRITLALKDQGEGIVPKEILYLKLENRDAAFKTLVEEHQGKHLVVSFPDEIAIEENRGQTRYYFHPSEGRIAEFRTDPLSSRPGTERSLQVTVCDVSEGGIAVFITEKDKTHFELKKKLRLCALDSFRLAKTVTAEILFSIPFTIRDGVREREGYKVGLRFETLLGSANLERFVNRKVVFSIDEAQLVRDQAFRERVKENVVQIRKTLNRVPTFKDFLNVLDRQGGDEHYLRQHIHLLCQILTGLGTSLGWISERSIDKLIYVAYLHDIRFAKYPRLARIPSLKAFELKKDKFSEEEQVAFMEAPLYAAELARQDLSAFPDAIKILQQQKELPDGSGFPQGLKGSQISPLGALFIVSHHLVDYIIDHPDWSADEFVSQYQHQMKGQYFSKILQAIKG